MSKRFGRNQKRQMRHELADAKSQSVLLNSALERNRGLLAYQAQTIQDLENALLDAKEIAGNMSVLFPAEEIRFPGKPRANLNVSLDANSKLLSNMGTDMYLTVQRLHVMLAELRLDHLRNSTHVTVKFGEEMWGYGISEEAIINTPTKLLVERIAKTLAKTIAPQLKALYSSPALKLRDQQRVSHVPD